MGYLKCDNPTPPIISLFVFYNVSKDIPLYVPNGTKAAYQAANGWKDFTNIIEVNNDITVSSNTVDLTSTNTAKVNVTTTGSWTATCDQTWLTFTPTSGDGAGEITITAEPNTTYETRTATVKVTSLINSDASKTITITQAGKPIPSIVLSTQTIDFTTANTAKVTVSTTGTWAASSQQSWLTISPASGDGNGEISITAEPNTTYEARTATIKVASLINSDTSKTITITQAGKPIPSIVLSTQTIDFTSTTTAKVTVTTTGSWTATCDQTWLTFTPTSGDGAGEITITAEPNTTGATRTATITIVPKLKADGDAKTITVTQAAQNTALAGEGNSETSIYPNPTHSHITIGAPAAEGQVVSLIAPNGAVLAQTSVSGGTAQFSVVGLPKGIYTVQLQSNVKAVWQRVVVE